MLVIPCIYIFGYDFISGASISVVKNWDRRQITVVSLQEFQCTLAHLMLEDAKLSHSHLSSVNFQLLAIIDREN